jgi:hypothetical protein
VTAPWRPEQANPNDTIWRYLEISRFISLLQTGELFLPTLAKLKKTDPMEGLFLPEYLTDSIIEEMARLGEPPPTPDYLEMRQKNMTEGLDQYQHHYLISCWHRSETESQAMWKLYGDGQQTVAIKSNVQRLFDCPGTWMEIPRLEYGKVEYIPYERGLKWQRPVIAIFHKDISLQHEKELRLVYHSFAPLNTDGGMGIPINRERLIEFVVISPYAGTWLKGVVEQLVVKYGCPNIPVVASRLTDPPKSL